MKVLLINTSERMGGAAIAASRLLRALRADGIDAGLLVRDKQTEDKAVVPLRGRGRQMWNFLWERFVIWLHNGRKRSELFAVSLADTGNDVTKLPIFRAADVIHLHWVNQGMLSLPNISRILASGKHVVWTMHDMWPFTGICHYAGACTRYQNECGDCPYLHGSASEDLSTTVFRRKQRLYETARITFVAPSRWLAAEARKSTLLKDFPIEVIPNPIDTTIFRPQPLQKNALRAAMGWPEKKKLILFGAAKVSDERKGVNYFVQACHLLNTFYPETAATVAVVAVGKHADALKDRLPFSVYIPGYVRNEQQMANIYAAVDLYVTPSLEDNLPNTVMEAMACGLPCVGFQIGGIPELIDHLQNGYLARYRDAEDLATGIHRMLNPATYEALSRCAVQKVNDHYAEKIIATRYENLYHRLIQPQ
ncbi:MAG: glycosyltransferase family 4 protein [Prevotellaceae bacterium]|jgi:glycosyltransferase involved in cell wall biosynthesis|nr:glycosyltransferase family 4 protein [Prevotellaceae bacterium]